VLIPFTLFHLHSVLYSSVRFSFFCCVVYIVQECLSVVLHRTCIRKQCNFVHGHVFQKCLKCLINDNINKSGILEIAILLLSLSKQANWCNSYLEAKTHIKKERWANFKSIMFIQTFLKHNGIWRNSADNFVYINTQEKSVSHII